MPGTLLNADQLTSGAARLGPHWDANPERLVRTVEFPDFLTAVAFIDALAPIAEDLDHHPDLRLSWRTVEITLATHSAGGVTDLDVTLADAVNVIVEWLT